MASLPANNPPIPFVGYISRGLRVGTKITIRGIMTHRMPRFTVDLQEGNNYKQKNISLHLSVRPSESTIVRNHMQNFTWGVEERIGSCPIEVGQAYIIEILVEKGRYTIQINGSHFCEFLHRLPLQTTSYIRIDGGTILLHVGSAVMPAKIDPLVAYSASASAALYGSQSIVHPAPIQPNHDYSQAYHQSDENDLDSPPSYTEACLASGYKPAKPNYS